MLQNFIMSAEFEISVEIFSFIALKQSWLEGQAPHHREHVDEYLLEHPEIFRTGQLQVPALKCAPKIRLTVDTEEDWHRANALVQQADDEWLITERIIKLCSVSV